MYQMFLIWTKGVAGRLGVKYDLRKSMPWLVEHILCTSCMGNGRYAACKEQQRQNSSRVAAGRFEARREGLLGPWDIAAGSITG